MMKFYALEPVSNASRILGFLVTENFYYGSIERDKITYPKRSSEPKDNIVFIIDESIRYDSISMNNPGIDTTPFIDSLENVKNMGLVVSVGTASFNADVSLPTGTSFFPDKEYRAFKNPTLFDIAKHNGYKTTIIDCPSTNFPNLVIRNKDMESVDNLITKENIGIKEEFMDIAAAKYIKNLLSSSKGNFVVVYKNGSHFHYETTYPTDKEEFVRFKPKLSLYDQMGTKKKEMRNSYKNSVYFNVDHFFKEMMPEDKSNTSFIYTSDHGQSLQENGVVYTHGKTEIHQALVPWFFVSDHKWFSEDGFPAKDFKNTLLTHHHIYPTIASMLFNNKQYRNGEYVSVFDESFDSTPFKSKYVVGNFWMTPQIFEIDYEKARKAIDTSAFK